MKKLIIFLLIFPFLLIVEGRILAQDRISLDDCIKAALANRSKLKALSQDQLIASLQTSDLKAKFWPQVSLSYDYRYNPLIQTSIIPIGQFYPLPTDEIRAMQFGTKWQQNAGVNVYQPLIDASVASQLAESKLQERLKELDVQNAENELRYEVTKTYASIQLAQLDIKDSALDTLRTFQSLTLMKTRFDEGRLLKTEYNKARVNHNHMKESLELAITEFVKQVAYLSYLTTLPYETLIRGQYDIPSANLPVSSGLEFNAARVASINQLQAQDLLLDRQIQTEKRKNIPTLGVEGFLGANQFSNNFNPFQGNSWYGASYLGLSAKWKLLSGENRGNHLRQLSMQKTSLSLQIDEQTQLTQKELRELDAQITTQQQNIESVNENVTLLRESLNILQERLNAGKTEPNEVNSLEIDLQKEILKQQNLRQQLQLNILKRLYTAGLL